MTCKCCIVSIFDINKFPLSKLIKRICLDQFFMYLRRIRIFISKILFSIHVWPNVYCCNETLFTFPIIWPCVLDLFGYQILSTTFHYVLNESCRDFFFIVIANWIHVSILAYEMTIRLRGTKHQKSLFLCKQHHNRKINLYTCISEYSICLPLCYHV